MSSWTSSCFSILICLLFGFRPGTSLFALNSRILMKMRPNHWRCMNTSCKKAAHSKVSVVCILLKLMFSPVFWIVCSASMVVQEVLCSPSRRMQPSCTTSRTPSSTMRWYLIFSIMSTVGNLIFRFVRCLFRFMVVAVTFFHVVWVQLFVESSLETLSRHFFPFILLSKASSVLKHQPQESLFLSPSDKDGAPHPAAWEASPPLHLLSCQLWKQQQEERPSGDSRSELWVRAE